MTSMQNSADPQRGHKAPLDSSGTQQNITASDDRALPSPPLATGQSAADSTQAFSQAIAAPDGNAPSPNERSSVILLLVSSIIQ